MPAIIVCSIILFILCFLAIESRAALFDIGLTKLLGGNKWYPTEGLFGLQAVIFGSFASSILATIIAGFVGFGMAVGGHSLLPKGFFNVIRLSMGILATLPSVVLGFWGLIVVVPLINIYRPPGASLLAASFVLSIMILPVVFMILDRKAEQVLKEFKPTNSALGLRKSTVFLSVLRPILKKTTLVAVVLAMGRAIGETIAVMMVAGNIIQIPLSIFDPVRSLPSHIALEMAYAVEAHRSALFFSGLMLALVASALVVLTRKVVD